jgi:hypothetical protein
MEALILNTHTLPSQIRKRIHTPKVSVTERNGGGVLLPMPVGNGLRGIAAQSKLTTEKMRVFKNQEANNMKKVLLIVIPFIAILLFSGCEKADTISDDEKDVDYTSFLTTIYENDKNGDSIEFSIKDLDNSGIPELITKRNGVDITVYTFVDGSLEDYGSQNFETGTTRLFLSDNSLYPGVFSFYLGGGLNHYGYISIKDNKLFYEELWNEDYSGISKELGEEREKIEEISVDKQLINESKIAYEENNDLQFQKLDPNNF